MSIPIVCKFNLKVLCLGIPSIFCKNQFYGQILHNDGWPSWGWWVTILGMLGYHPIDCGSPLYSAQSPTIRPWAWYLHLVRRLMLRLRAHSLYFVRSLTLRLRTKSVKPVSSGFQLIKKKYVFEKLLKLTFYKSGGYSNNF